jgi:hypothetical protein
MERVFISHASADEPLIDAFVDLLHIGLNLRQENIFCTSLEGTGIPRGSNFVSFIRKSFKGAQFVIMVITPAYYESAFCLCELGATWILGSDAMPLLVPPLEFDDLRAVLVGVQAGHINDKRALNELRDRLVSAGIASGATHKWETKRDTFIKVFPKLAAKLKGRTSVPASEHDGLRSMYEEAQDSIVEKDEKIQELQETIQDLRECKDAAQVKKVMSKRSTTEQRFKALTEAVRAELHNLPNKAIDALYYDTKEEEWHPPSGIDTADIWEEIEAARRRGLVCVDEGQVAVDDSSPKMKRARKAISDLASLMQDAPRDFVAQFEEDYDYQFDIGNRDFWNDQFEV